MDHDFLLHLAGAVAAGRPATLVTVIGVEGSVPTQLGARMLVEADGACGTIGGGELERRVVEAVQARDIARPERLRYDLGGNPTGESTGMACGGGVEVLVEPLFAPDRLYIAGGGHCGVELSALARRVGFHVTVIDDRPAWASREKHPGAHAVVCVPYPEAGRQIGFSDRAYVVIMTHGHEHDEQVLRQCLRRPLRYLGMLGSEAKVRACFQRLRAEGYADEELGRVRAPVGLPIGSRTPAEIAVSIAAQLVAVRNEAD